MPTLPVLSRILPLATLLVSVALAVPMESAAQQRQQGSDSAGQVFKKPHRGPAVGGTSWTLSDVWGEPEMPEPSMDYPGYDYPPGGYDLNGPPNTSPYPN